MIKQGYVYIITNKNHTVLYVGVTSRLKQRVSEHREQLRNCFSSRYQLKKLVYFECYYSITDAIAREKQLKAGSRKNKLKLINETNPGWIDLWDVWSFNVKIASSAALPRNDVQVVIMRSCRSNYSGPFGFMFLVTLVSQLSTRFAITP